MKERLSNGEVMKGTFPPGFFWGMATSSYQTEGAWNVDGKGENVWDRFCHQTPSPIADKSTGDVTMDSYHKYKEDVALLKNMNANMYRFSISWARILPNGKINEVNQKGIEYYNNLIDELLRNGIQPCVTLFHWDLPQALWEETGGFTNEVLISHFVEYARLCFRYFGDRVKWWTTFNEPYIYIIAGYTWLIHPPAINDPLKAPYTVVHAMIKAHALAWKVYQEEFKDAQGGKVGIVVDAFNYSPKDPNSEEDVKSVEKAFQFRLGWILRPLILGDYPEVMKSCVAAQSKKEGMPCSRLPEFDEISRSLVKGAIDFIGVNYYTSELVQPLEKVNVDTCTSNGPGWHRDLGLDITPDKSGPACGAYWQHDVPTGFRKTLNWIKKEYNNFPILVTECGMSSVEHGLEDEDRVNFFKGHISEMLRAIKEDGCNVLGFLGWSLLDVMEWSSGFTLGFGVHQVDRAGEDKKRTPKKSAKFLTNVFKDNGIL